MIILKNNERFLYPHLHAQEKYLQFSDVFDHIIVDKEDYWQLVNFINQNPEIKEKLEEHLGKIKYRSGQENEQMSKL
jgi:hypothetical protein